MTCQRQDTETWSAVELIAERGVEGLPDAMACLINEAMRVERDRHVGAGRYERSAERRGYANGYKARTMKTRMGALELRVPQVREGGFYPQSLDKGLRSERALKLVLAQMYVEGVSTRKVARITEQLCGFEVSSTEVSRCTALLDEELSAWRERELGVYPYVYLDARYEKVRHGGQVIDAAVLVALGVDEVARAKGHDYVTVVYNLDTGDLLWVGDGRNADSFGAFLAEWSAETAAGIQAVAMDMGLAYQAAVKAQLPEAVIVFDRFHVMKLYSDVIRTVRRAEFRKADAEGKQVIKGSLYLLLGNKQRLDESGIQRLNTLMQANQTLVTVYTLKEQLPALWGAPDEAAMRQALNRWCDLARATNITPLQCYAKMLVRHADGICAYARFKLTTARIEAGNVAIGMIRKRARELLDQDYFKLKIRQTAVPEPPLQLFPKARKLPHASA